MKNRQIVAMRNVYGTRNYEHCILRPERLVQVMATRSGHCMCGVNSSVSAVLPRCGWLLCWSEAGWTEG